MAHRRAARAVPEPDAPESGCASGNPGVPAANVAQAQDKSTEVLMVDCRLPGQVRRLSRNATQRDVADVSEIDSGIPPDDMHEVSIADAIAQHRPALVVFATIRIDVKHYLFRKRLVKGSP